MGKKIIKSDTELDLVSVEHNVVESGSNTEEENKMSASRRVSKLAYILSHKTWAGIGGIAGITAVLITFFTINDSDKSEYLTWTPKVAYDYRVGPLYFTNDFQYRITVELWHPDSLGGGKAAWKQYDLSANEYRALDLGSPGVGVAGDWGVRIIDPNARILNLRDVANWSEDGGGHWSIKASIYYQKMKQG